MKKTFAVIMLGCVSILSAGQYGQSYGYQSTYCPSYNNGGYTQNGSVQNQPQNDDWYSQGQPYDGRGYNQYQYQGQSNNGSYGQQNGQYSQQSNPYNSQQQTPRNQSYGQNQQYSQNQPYSQPQNNRYDSQDQQVSGYDTNADQNSYSEAQLKASESKYTRDVAATQNDRQLNAKIRDKLSGGYFSKNYENIVIKSSNGAVVLTGTVDDVDDIQKINKEIKNVEGVRTVNNLLTVQKN